jgi:hypothetical protein
MWSFLMASAHGAGLMLFPVLIIWVVSLHTAAMFAVMGTVAIAVYDWIGLGILRTGWINVDKLWAATLLGSGLIVLLA